MFQRKFQLFFIDASSFVSIVMVAELLPLRMESGSRTQLAVGLVLAPPVKTSDDPVHSASVPLTTVAGPTPPVTVLGTDEPAVRSKWYSATSPVRGAAAVSSAA